MLIRAGFIGLALLSVAACSGVESENSGAPPTIEPRDGTGAGEQIAQSGDARTSPSAEANVDVEVDRVLSGEQSFPEGFTVPAGEVWELASEESTTIETGGNVIVQGVLRMRPVDHDITHVLRFVGVDETEFVGGGMEVLESDVGLWVTGEGQLDIAGSPRTSWNRTGTDPSWQAGDEILLAPIEPGDSTTFASFEPGSAVPTVSNGGQTYATEVLNLTRNVRIEGTGDGEASPATNGRAHIWINSISPQTIRYAELRHLGPREWDDDDPTDGVHGRYPLHFHMSDDGVRGSLVEGVVVRDAGNHAFVVHRSHGVTLRDTIAFNVFEEAYWWDPDATGHGGPAPNATNDLLIEHAMAAFVRSDPDFRGYILSGFFMGEGENLSLTDSVAVGVQGNETASGFHWPATANGNEHNMWNFHDNVAHNNRTSGIFVWQNDENDHLIKDFVGYHNGAYGVDHGAYNNNYQYDQLVLFGNGEAGIRSKAAGGQEWTNIDTDGIVIGEHALPSETVIEFEGLTLRGKVILDETESPSAYEFRDSRTGDGDELSTEDFEIRRQTSPITLYLSDGSVVEF